MYISASLNEVRFDKVFRDLLKQKQKIFRKKELKEKFEPYHFKNVEIIGEMKIKTYSIRFSFVEEVGGRKMIDIRRYLANKQATKSGIRISVSDFPDFLNMCKKVGEYLLMKGKDVLREINVESSG